MKFFDGKAFTRPILQNGDNNAEKDFYLPKSVAQKPKMDDSSRKELARLERENNHLNRRLMQAEQIIEIQKKSDFWEYP